MSLAKIKIDTAFRKFEDGEVIALFPTELWNRFDSTITSYMHIGQHGGAHPDLLEELDKASPEEYSELKQELSNVGYEVEVI